MQVNTEQERKWTVVRRERMDRAVAAGKKLFLACKIENVKMTQIAEEAGYGVASLYRYFETKEAIAIAAAVDLWQDVKNEYMPELASETFLNKSGIEQIRILLDTYSMLLRDHRPFLLFLADFDAFCLKQGITGEKLADYKKALGDFYLPYTSALEKGKADHTVTVPEDPELFYLTISHAMLALMQKLAAGDLFSEEQAGERELETMKELILVSLHPR